MEEYINTLVDNTFKNHDFEEAKKIIADKISWYEMKLLNSVNKDKIGEKIKELEETMEAICDKEDVEDYQCEEYYKLQVLKELLEE